MCIRDSGLHRLNISLDSLREERYRQITRRGELQQVLRGIELAERVGLEPIKINTVIMRGVNDDEVRDFARLTQVKPIQVRFIELMPLGEAESIENERFISNSEIMKQLPELIPLVPDREYQPGPAKYLSLIHI